jgi:hypothetical protein
MKCTRCRGEFCYACGGVWDNSHYGCARPAATNTDLLFDSRRDLRAWCLGGCDRWEGMMRLQAPSYWSDILTVEGVVQMPQALEVLAHVHLLILEGCSLMKSSFAIDLSIPAGLQYAVARRRLASVRGDLERSLEPLIQHLLPRTSMGMDGNIDLRVPLAIAHAIETDAAVRDKVLMESDRLRQTLLTLKLAGRAGILTGTLLYLMCDVKGISDI